MTSASDRISQATEAAKRSLRRKVDEFLRQPDNEHVRDMALRSLGLPEDMCEDAAEARRCARIASDRLYEMAHRYLFNTANPGEVRQLDLQKAAPILRNARFVTIMKSVYDEMFDSLMPPEKLKHIKDVVFERVRTQVISRIRNMPIEDGIKQKILRKIRNITFAGTDCGAGSTGAHHFNPGAFYNPADNSISLCKGNLVSTTSEFTMAYVLAHEIGHAFDPCTIGDEERGALLAYSNSAGPGSWEGQFPMSQVTSCLRQPTSIGARVRTPPAPPAFGAGAPGGDYYYPNPYGAPPSGQGGPMPPGGPQYYPPYTQAPYGEGYGNSSSPSREAPPRTEASARRPRSDRRPPRRISANGDAGGSMLAGNSMGAGAPAPSMPGPWTMQGGAHAGHTHPHVFNGTQCALFDQIGEAFPDWIAAETLPEYIAQNHPNLTPAQLRTGYSNVWSWACADTDHEGRHPRTRDRINRILAVNPRIREQMRCQSPAEGMYCDLNGASARGAVPQAPVNNPETTR